MKTLIIYCSQHKRNTEKIANVFKEKGECYLINLKKKVNINLEGYDLIGFGSGVYVENVSPKLFRLIEELDLKNKNVFVFSTSGVGMKFYNNKLIKALEARGAINKGSFSCKGSYDAEKFTDNKIFKGMSIISKGHPNNRDLKKAQKFFIKIISSL